MTTYHVNTGTLTCSCCAVFWFLTTVALSLGLGIPLSRRHDDCPHDLWSGPIDDRPSRRSVCPHLSAPSALRTVPSASFRKELRESADRAAPPLPSCRNPQYTMGPLEDLLEWNEGRTSACCSTWENKDVERLIPGFNLVSVPDADGGVVIVSAAGESGGASRGMNYTETVTFCPIPASTLNRGFANASEREQGNQILGGVTYSLSIYSLQADGSLTYGPELLHVESGMYMYVCQPGVHDDDYTVVRMSSIPHGSTVNSVGNVSNLNVDETGGGVCEQFPNDPLE